MDDMDFTLLLIRLFIGFVIGYLIAGAMYR